MDSADNPGFMMLGLGIAGTLFLYFVVGLGDIFALTGEGVPILLIPGIDISIPPVLLTLSTIFCFLVGVGFLTGILDG